MTNEEFKVICDARIAAAQAFTAACYARCQNAIAIVKARLLHGQIDATPWTNEYNIREDQAEVPSLPVAPNLPTGPVPGDDPNYPNPTE
jgi:hypothetical protein